MKTILHLKQADLYLQALALFVPIFICAVKANTGYLFLAYLMVGGVQTLSCLANIGLKGKLRSDRRRYYEISLALIFGLSLFLAAFLGETILMLGLALLFISPFIAIWYAIICLDELMIVKRYVNRNKYVMTN